MSALALVVALAVAGCTGDEPAPADASRTEAPTEAETGSVEGLVVDEQFLPLRNATVGLIGTAHQTVTDAEGRFALSGVAPGSYVAGAIRVGYEPGEERITVAAGETTTVELILDQIPVPEPYHLTQEGSGIFGCGFTYTQGVTTAVNPFLGFTLCFVLPEDLDTAELTFDLQDSVELWEGAVFETQWQSSQALGNGLVQDWLVTGCNNDRNATFGRATGASPLRNRLGALQIDLRLADLPNSGCDAPERCNEDECHLLVRIFSWPATTGEGAPVDLGVTVQQRFTSYMAEFYSMEPPPGYSSVA